MQGQPGAGCSCVQQETPLHGVTAATVTPRGTAGGTAPSAHLIHRLDEEVVEEVPLLVRDSLRGEAQALPWGPPQANAMTPLPSYQGKRGVTMPCGNSRPSWDTVGKSLLARVVMMRT